MADYTKHHTQAGKIGGLVRGALKTNEAVRKAAAAEGRMRRFFEQVPAHITDPVERAQAANLLQRAHMSRLAKKSAEGRTRAVPPKQRRAA
ncbi:hypothetical protein ACH4T9_12270 [Micromonospora sp. NPDC020750]|uniref:hypothetical protein n=1 Tax=unclassified Micromonospora TaxID=2617518 RepID=UPI0037B888FB